MMGIKGDWLLWSIKFLIKTKGSGATTFTNKSAINSLPQNKQLTEELYKPVIKKNKKNRKSIFSIQRQYLGCRFSRYAINK